MIKWGMIGAGDVTEVKSGPAFRKVADSDLLGVMRRDQEKVRDYADRHAVPNWYTDVDALLRNTDINAIYIATPPNVHLYYVQKALEAGKYVYVEKPLAVSAAEAEQMKKLVHDYSGKLVVAHYRRSIPYFVKIKEIVEGGLIGTPRSVSLRMCKKAQTREELTIAKNQWRVDPAVSGGGLFHDLAPHQLDFIVSIFGHPTKYSGISDSCTPALRVAGQLLFKDNVLFDGMWDFDRQEEVDFCEITGSQGTVRFSFFGNDPIRLQRIGEDELQFTFERLQHVQQPMIARTVQYFLGKDVNPCPIEEGVICMQLLDAFTK